LIKSNAKAKMTIKIVKIKSPSISNLLRHFS